MKIIRSNALQLTKQILVNKGSGIVLITRPGYGAYFRMARLLEGIENSPLPIYHMSSEGDNDYAFITMLDYQPKSLPAVLFFEKGVMSGRITGYITLDEILQKLDLIEAPQASASYDNLKKEIMPFYQQFMRKAAIQ